MQLLADHLLIYSSLISAIGTLIVAVALLLFLRIYLREKSLSRYDDKEHRAIISDMRASYEAKIREMTADLLATEARFRDVNHLLISSQKSVPDQQTQSSAWSEFLRNMGLQKSDLKLDPRLVLVLMPFDPHYDEVYAAIVSVCRRSGLNCVRGDEERASGDVLAHILRLMAKSRLVIADITERNPNVYYELGIAHAMDKSTVLISQSIEGIPFNLQSTRILVYQDIDQLKTALAESLLRAVASQPNLTASTL